MRQMTRYGVVAFAFLFSGFFCRDLAQHTNEHTLANLLILKRHNSREYRLQTDRGQAFEVTICKQPLDWRPGEKLQVWNYEQVEGCKINLGFVAYTDSEGNRLKFSTQELADAAR